MNDDEMKETMKKMPKPVAIFKIVKLPDWYGTGFIINEEKFSVGDEVMKWNNGEYCRLKSGKNVCYLRPEYLEFVRYDTMDHFP